MKTKLGPEAYYEIHKIRNIRESFQDDEYK